MEMIQLKKYWFVIFRTLKKKLSFFRNYKIFLFQRDRTISFQDRIALSVFFMYNNKQVSFILFLF